MAKRIKIEVRVTPTDETQSRNYELFVNTFKNVLPNPANIQADPTSLPINRDADCTPTSFTYEVIDVQNSIFKVTVNTAGAKDYEVRSYAWEESYIVIIPSDSDRSTPPYTNVNVNILSGQNSKTATFQLIFSSNPKRLLWTQLGFQPSNGGVDVGLADRTIQEGIYEPSYFLNQCVVTNMNVTSFTNPTTALSTDFALTYPTSEVLPQAVFDSVYNKGFLDTVQSIATSVESIFVNSINPSTPEENSTWELFKDGAQLVIGTDIVGSVSGNLAFYRPVVEGVYTLKYSYTIPTSILTPEATVSTLNIRQYFSSDARAYAEWDILDNSLVSGVAYELVTTSCIFQEVDGDVFLFTLLSGPSGGTITLSDVVQPTLPTNSVVANLSPATLDPDQFFNGNITFSKPGVYTIRLVVRDGDEEDSLPNDKTFTIL